MRHGAFAVAVGRALALKHGQVLVECALRPFILEEIKHLHESVVPNAAAVFDGGGVELVGNVAHGHDTGFVHFGIGALYGICNFFLFDISELHHVPQEGKQASARVHAAAHVGEFEVAVGIDEAGHDDAGPDVERGGIVPVAAFHGEDGSFVVGDDHALFHGRGGDGEDEIGREFAHVIRNFPPAGRTP